MIPQTFISQDHPADKDAKEDAEYELELVDRLGSQCGRLRFAMVKYHEAPNPDVLASASGMTRPMAVAAWANIANATMKERMEIKRCEGRRNYASDVCSAHDTDDVNKQIAALERDNYRLKNRLAELNRKFGIEDEP